MINITRFYSCKDLAIGEIVGTLRGLRYIDRSSNYSLALGVILGSMHISRSLVILGTTGFGEPTARQVIGSVGRRMKLGPEISRTSSGNIQPF